MSFVLYDLFSNLTAAFPISITKLLELYSSQREREKNKEKETLFCCTLQTKKEKDREREREKTELAEQSECTQSCIKSIISLLALSIRLRENKGEKEKRKKKRRLCLITKQRKLQRLRSLCIIRMQILITLAKYTIYTRTN